MPTFVLPGAARWLSTALRALIGSVPALVAVVFGVVILFLGLFLAEPRRRYALRAATCAGELAKAMIGFGVANESTADVTSPQLAPASTG